jgi:hypothetical protein
VDRFERPRGFEARAFLVEPDFLPAARREELRAYLPRRMATARPGSSHAAQADRFLRAVSEAAFMAQTLRPAAAPDAVRRELGTLAARADALMRCLHEMSADAVSAFGAYFDELALASPERRFRADGLSDIGVSMVRSDPPFLPALWEMLADVEVASRYTLAHLRAPSRQVKVSEAATRGLVWHVAHAWRAVAGAWPGHSRGTWFPAFMRELVRGDPFRGRCGPELIASVMTDLRALDPDPPA